ncbi:MAG: hypothetical protein ABIJ57_00500 [Pseudomonadota bacterium]
MSLEIITPVPLYCGVCGKRIEHGEGFEIVYDGTGISRFVCGGCAPKVEVVDREPVENWILKADA